MAGYLLHEGATVTCAHSGQAQPAVTSPRVKVDGQAVVTQSGTYTISGCSFTTPAGAPLPCVTGQWITAATRVTAGGVPVLLQDSQSICTPNGTPMSIVNTQVKVKGS
jgi:uncharacterized Zn-binding protein involved in type VI secretion